ncbi:MAG: Asp23/Gls24 family envelope stress response protein [Eubacteriales bacterium]
MADNKDYLTAVENGGTVHISEEVIASIAALAANEVEGVCGLSANFSSDIAELLGKKNLGKGVKLQFTDDTIAMDVYVVALYGFSVIDIARNVQDQVTTAVESMTGRKVRSVNVEICGITLPKEAKK